MAQSAGTQKRDPREKIDAKVIAEPTTRHYRAAAFQAYALIASAIFVGIAILAHTSPYFPIDLTVTRAIQSIQSPVFERIMVAVSWIGFAPQVDILGAMVILLLYFSGLRWEAATAVFAAGGIALGSLVKLIVYRPRPSADLVHVFAQLPTSGFPSGHVLMCTAFIGFLTFLGYTLLKKSWERSLLLGAFAVLIVLMGLSRMYLGQHWFSDVMGAYLLGSLWLALTIRVYRWGKTRYFVRQPVAPAVPATPGS
jgi:membrane-associated phospholipid phosphatase